MDCFEGCYLVAKTFVTKDASERVIFIYNKGLVFVLIGLKEVLQKVYN